jgi:hypothetical protein
MHNNRYRPLFSCVCTQLLSFFEDPELPVGVDDPALYVLYSLNTSSLCLAPILPRQKQLCETATPDFYLAKMKKDPPHRKK